MAFNWLKRKPKQLEQKKSHVGSALERAYTSKRGVGPVDAIEAYRGAPWARALTDKIASAVATSLMTIKIYDQGIKSNKEGTAALPIDNHDFSHFLKHGCKEMSLFTAWEVTYKIMHLTGACAWHIRRNKFGRKYDEYYPIPLSWVSGLNETDFFNQSNYDYVSITYPDGRVFSDVKRSDLKIFFLRDPGNPYDHNGTSVIQALAGEFDTDSEAARALRHGYKNNLTPSMLVSLEDAEPEEVDRVYNGMSKNRGAAGHGSAFFTNRKVNVQQLQQSLGQTPIIEHRKFSRDNAIQVHGVPLEMLGVTESSNRATVEAAEYIFYRSTIIPKLEFMVAELQRQFLWDENEFSEQDLILKYENPLPDNEESKRLLMTSRPDAFKKNEFREAAGLPPLSEAEGGLDFPISIDPYNPTPRDIEGKPKRKPDARGVGSGSKVLSGERLGAVDKSFSRFDIQLIIDSIRFSEIADTDRLKKIYIQLVNEIGEDAAKEVIAQTGVKFGLDPNRVSVAAFVSDTMAILEYEVGNVFGKDMSDILLDANADGLGLKATAKRIREKFNVDNARAARIARTETTRASGFARQDVYEQSGVVKYKQWFHISGSHQKARQRHIDMDKSVVPVGHKFRCEGFVHGSKYIPTDYAKYPGSFSRLENNVNCRCSTLPWVEHPGEQKALDVLKSARLIEQTIERDRKYLEIMSEAYSEIVQNYQDAIIAKLGKVIDE